MHFIDFFYSLWHIVYVDQVAVRWSTFFVNFDTVWMILSYLCWFQLWSPCLLDFLPLLSSPRLLLLLWRMLRLCLFFYPFGNTSRTTQSSSPLKTRSTGSIHLPWAKTGSTGKFPTYFWVLSIYYHSNSVKKDPSWILLKETQPDVIIGCDTWLLKDSYVKEVLAKRITHRCKKRQSLDNPRRMSDDSS